MKIAVVDDEKIIRESLCELIYKHYNSLDVICDTFCDGSELVAAYSKGRSFDVIFLDIEMPKLDGMQTAERIRNFSADVPIVFLTSHTERAIDGYEVNAFRFLPKTLDKSKLSRTLDELAKQFSQNKKIILKCGLTEYVVHPENIVFAESDNNTVRFVASDKSYSVRMKLSNALTMLNEAIPVFVKVHRCSIVNLAHVCGYSDKEVSMDNGVTVPVSKSCAEDFRKKMLGYIKYSAR